MIQIMVEPADDFARYLQQLRRERRWGVTSLSTEIGKGRSYLHEWEANPKAVPKPDVLLDIAKKLDLSEPEKAKLFYLAHLRTAPEGARHLYTPAINTDANLWRGLADVPHDWPDEPETPNPAAEQLKPFLDAVGWALTVRALQENRVIPATMIRWPDLLIEANCASLPAATSGHLVIPPMLAEEEMGRTLRSLEQDKEHGKLGQRKDHLSPAWGMACIYKRLVFSDPKTATAATELLSYWGYDRSDEAPQALSLTFGPGATRPEDMVVDVSCRKVADVCHFLAASLLHPGLGEHSIRWKLSWSRPAWDALDTIAREDPEKFEFYRDGQEVRDALFALSSGYADYEAMCRERSAPNAVEKALGEQLANRSLTDKMRREIIAQPVRLAAVPDKGVLVQYLEWLNDQVPPLEPEPTPGAPRRGSKGKK